MDDEQLDRMLNEARVSARDGSNDRIAQSVNRALTRRRRQRAPKLALVAVAVMAIGVSPVGAAISSGVREVVGASGQQPVPATPRQIQDAEDAAPDGPKNSIGSGLLTPDRVSECGQVIPVTGGYDPAAKNEYLMCEIVIAREKGALKPGPISDAELQRALREALK